MIFQSSIYSYAGSFVLPFPADTEPLDESEFINPATNTLELSSQVSFQNNPFANRKFQDNLRFISFVWFVIDTKAAFEKWSSLRDERRRDHMLRNILHIMTQQQIEDEQQD
jgi:myosin-crossreactive antigen